MECCVMKKNLLFVLASLFLTVSCSTMTPAEKEQKKVALDEMVQQTVASLIAQSPAIEGKVEESLAYAVADMKLTKVPIVGAGGGEGVLVVKDTQQRIYFTVRRLDLGGGWGARAYKTLLVVESEEVLERLRDGTWEFQAGAEASAGSVSAEGSSSNLNQGFAMYVLSEGGASATVTARVIRIKVNGELTE